MRGRDLVEGGGLVETCSRRLRQVNMRGGGLVET